MAKREEAPKVNAGSMADIAFLLLIFFLVTTSIETDAGLDRLLARKDINPPPPPPVFERNILPILLNEKGELFVDDEITPLDKVKDIAVDFIDNGGAVVSDPRHCNYCKGDRDTESSDSPAEAIVSLNSSRNASYGVYIAVQNELVAAYNTLRNREALRLYKTDYTSMEAVYFNPETSKENKAILRSKIKHIQELFPLNISEAARN